MDGFLLAIISETSFPVAGPRLHPIMAWPVAIVRLSYFDGLPIKGSPSGDTGLSPHLAAAFSGSVILRRG